MGTSSPDAIHVLHADDDPDLADLTAAVLERDSDRLTVETVGSADEGLSRLADPGTDVDCIVSDYDMPGRNGIEFLEAVREDHPDLPFVLYTGKGSEEVASDAISAGVTDYLQKETGSDQYALLANRIVNAVERARAEQARQRHLRAIETAQEGISILDDGEFVYVNEAYAALYGYDREELVGEHWELLYPDEDVRAIHEEVMERVESNGFWRGETIGLRADGTTFVEDHRLATTEHGELVCTVLDTSERRARERAIEELHTTARAFIRAETAEAVADIAVDAVSDILDMPANGVHFYDEGEGALVPVTWTDRTEELVDEPPVFGPGESLAWTAFESGEPVVEGDISSDPRRHNPETAIRSQIVLPLDDRGVHLIGSPEPDAFDETDVSLANTVAAHATTALDRVEREQDLARQNDRLETFTDVVSHDLRNPLDVATGRLELAREDCSSPYLDDAERAIERAVTLLDDLRTFARAGAAAVDAERVSLPELWERCRQHVATERVTLVTETDRVIRADRSRLRELLENLVRNAAEHGGGVTVTVGDLETGFYVADDGPGIPAEERERVFDHGYSTSDTGTGFGLSIVRVIAESHGWDVSVTESDEGGARFELSGVEIVDQ